MCLASVRLLPLSAIVGWGEGASSPTTPLLSGGGHQRGVVLVTTLVFLMLLTLIGVTAMRGTVQEERMSSNLRQRDLAFQAAEAALRAGEAILDPAITANLPAYNGTWLRDTGARITDTIIQNCDAVTYWTKGYCWTGTTSIDCSTDPPTTSYSSCAAASQSANINGGGVLSAEPLYIIERLFPIVGTGGTSGALCAGCPRTGGGNQQSIYRVTARGVGGTNSAVVILQSLVIR